MYQRLYNAFPVPLLEYLISNVKDLWNIKKIRHCKLIPGLHYYYSLIKTTQRKHTLSCIRSSVPVSFVNNQLS
jgi:hypothetical protein